MGSPVALYGGLLSFELPLLLSTAIGSVGSFTFGLSYLNNNPANTSRDGTVGLGFNYPQNMVLVQQSGAIQFLTAQNTQELFVGTGNGPYSSGNNNTMAVLTRTGAGTSADAITMISRDGVITQFWGLHSSISTPGRIKTITDRFGNTQTQNWGLLGGQVRLLSVTDSYGRTSTFSYYGSIDNYRLQQITDFLGRQVNFQFDSAGRLVAIVGPSITRGANNNSNTFPNGTAYVFQYDVDNPRTDRQNDLIAIWHPNQVAPNVSAGRTVNVSSVYSGATARQLISYYNDSTDAFQYGKVQEVIESASGSGSIGVGAWGYMYVTSGLPSNLIDPSDPIVSRTIKTDRNGNQTTYDFDAANMVVRKEAFATRGKNSLEASSWITWTMYNTHNQPLLVVMPEGNSIAYAYEDETNTIVFGGIPYGRRIGLLNSVTRLPGNSIGIPSRPGSGPSGGVQSELTSRQFNDPIFNQLCASIEERGNPIDPTSGAYFPPQNLGTTPTNSDRSRYATINYYDYQKDTAAVVQADTALQTQLGLTSTQIGQLITFVSNQMTAAGGTGGLPAGFEMGIGDVNGEGTGNGTSVNARHQGSVVQVAHPSVRQLIPNITYAQAVLSDSPNAYWQLGEYSGTVANDATGDGYTGAYSGSYTLGQPGEVVNIPSVLLSGGGVTGSGLPSNAGGVQVTVEAWIKPSGSGLQSVFTKGRAGTSYGYGLSFNGTTLNAVTTTTDYALGSGVVAGVWNHVAVVYSATGATGYINGVAVGSNGSAVATADTQDLWAISGRPGSPSTNAYSGNVQEVAIYPTALSASRILAHYQVGAGLVPWVWAEQERVEVFTSNARGQQTTATDPEGNLSLFVRYPENDPEGAGQYLVPTLSNQQYGFPKEIHVDADPTTVMSLIGSDGDMITFIGNLISRTNTPGVYQDLVTRFQADSSASGGCTSCAYDALGNPLSTTDPRGFTTLYDRNELGQAYRTTTDAPYSQKVETYYDANRNVIQVDTEDRQVLYNSTDPTDPGFGHFTPTGSGSNADLPTQAGPGGSVRPGWFSNLYSYDLLDNKTEDDIDATGSVPASLVTTYAYDFNQNLVTITKPQGNLVEYDYDERDLRIATRVGYSPSTGENGAVTVVAFDGNGNLIDTVGPADRGTPAQSLSVVIDDAFRSGSAMTHVGDWVAQNTYDGFDRLIQSTDAVGGTATNTFDPGGRAIATAAQGTAGSTTPTDRTGSLNVPLSSGATRFDEAGRAYEQQQSVFLNTGISGGSPTHGLPSTRTATHTGGGLASNSTANSNTGTVTLTTGGSSYVLARSVFDRANRLSASATDNTAIASYTYDGANRQMSMTDPLGNVVQNSFDGNGNVVSMTRAESCTITAVTTTESFASQMRYDLLNRLIVLIQQGPDGVLNPDMGTCCVPPETPNQTLFTLYGYDSRSNRTNLVDAKQNSTVWIYDGASRQLQNLRQMRTDGDGTQPIFETITTTSNYDGNGRLTRLVDNRGGTSIWNYDTLDRQVLMTFHDGSNRVSEYDLASDLAVYVDENGSIFTNTFDVLGRKTAVAITRATAVIGTTAQSFQYDGLSRMTYGRDSIASANTDAAFVFDSLSRIIEEGQTYG